jgi:hypothetical protein
MSIRKLIVVACCAVACSGLALLFGLNKYYYSARPREPRPEEKRIYVERVKGFDGVADVYLTRTERLPFDYEIWVVSGSMSFALAAFLLNQRWKAFSTGSHTPQSKLS